ncbi:MAG: acyl-CoA thioesterase [Candidatus Aphodosoma sp.]
MIYSLEFKVRDYECDLQGIVNNANYQHYYEHTRHEFLVENGISFAEMHDQGVDFVVARVEMAFKHPLKSKESFVSELDLCQEGVKYTFIQKIYRLPDRKLCNVGRFDCVCLDHGKLSRNSMLDDFVARVTK